MPRYFVRQPDGLLAAFSTVVDDFVAYDMTREEAEDFAANDWCCGPDKSTEIVKQAIDDMSTRGHGLPAAENPSLSPLGRWHDCLQTILFCHGWEECFERMQTIGKAGDK